MGRSHVNYISYKPTKEQPTNAATLPRSAHLNVHKEQGGIADAFKNTGDANIFLESVEQKPGAPRVTQAYIVIPRGSQE